MVHHVLTRTALYAAVWAEPIRTVARRLEVSAVGLAKACRVAAIPLPPREYWAKLQHGQPTRPRPPLPPRPGGESVVIAPPKKRPLIPPPEATAFEAIPVSDDLRRAHPIVRDWIAEDAATRRRFRREGWGARIWPRLWPNAACGSPAPCSRPSRATGARWAAVQAD